MRSFLTFSMLNHSTLSSVSSSKENQPPTVPSHPTTFSSATPAHIIPQNSLSNSYPPAYAHPPPPGSSPSQASYIYYHPIPPHPITSYTPRMPMDTHLALPWTILPQTCPTVTPITLHKTIQPYLPSLLIHPHHTHLLITLDINPYPLPCIIYLQKAPSIYSLPLIHNFCHTIPHSTYFN